MKASKADAQKLVDSGEEAYKLLGAWGQAARYAKYIEKDIRNMSLRGGVAFRPLNTGSTATFLL